MTAERLVEFVTSRGLKPTVDRAAGIITNVKILGWESRNGRTYLPAAGEKAKGLYESAKVNVDHKAGSRSYTDRLGSIRNVRVEAEGLFGDFKFNPKHALADQLCWDAENAPENLGFSHVVEGKVTRKDGKAVVEEITKVISVDLVADPATTRGLYESDQAMLEGDVQLRELAEHAFSATDQIRSILFAADKATDQKKACLAEVLATWQGELNARAHQQEGSDVNLKELTLEQLKAERPDLFEQANGTDAATKLKASEAEVATLKAKIAEHEAAQAKAAKSLKIAEELKAAFGDKATDKRIVSETFLAVLEAAADEAARKPLIEDRKAAFAVAAPAPQKPSTGAPPMAPLSETKTVAGKAMTLQETLAVL